MTNRAQLSTSLFMSSLRTRAFAIALTGSLILVAQTTHAQTYSIIHSFSGGSGGSSPSAGLTMDGAGNLYGTTAYGGYEGGNCAQAGCGMVFKLSRKNGAWLLTTLYRFQGDADGANPAARVVFGADGALYGTTQEDVVGQGGCNGLPCGTVFRLQPPATVCRAVNCFWTETVLYRFSGGADGGFPGYGDLIFDNAGNIYGTTELGGAQNLGTVYKLTHTNGGWTESVLYSFSGLDGAYPVGGLIFDGTGNLFGTTSEGGNTYHPPQLNGYGAIFELSPSGSGWTESTVHSLNDGQLPYAGLTLDAAGNLYGTASAGGGGGCYDGGEMYAGCGTVFSVVQNFYESLYDFFGPSTSGFTPGPNAPLTIDAAGNLYGTTNEDGANFLGNVFKLDPRTNTYTSLHDFDGADGSGPISNVVMDSNGNLYGTTSGGSSGGNGVIWEITP